MLFGVNNFEFHKKTMTEGEKRKKTHNTKTKNNNNINNKKRSEKKVIRRKMNLQWQKKNVYFKGAIEVCLLHFAYIYSP